MSKFCGSVENVEARPQSGYGVKELVIPLPFLCILVAMILVAITLYAQVLQALETFKAQYKKTFNLTHCYRALKDQQKWKDLYASLKQGGQPDDKEEGTTEKEGRPRGKNNSKAELKRDATTLALQIGRASCRERVCQYV